MWSETASIEGVPPVSAEPRGWGISVSRSGEIHLSAVIASNECFSGWTKTFTDPRLCAAIVDRLTFGGNIIETGTDSYRLAHTRAGQQA